MTKGFTLLAVFVVAAGLAIGAGLAMWQSGSQASATQPSQASQAQDGSRAQVFTRMAGGEAPGNAAGGAFIAGVVESTTEDAISLRTPNGTMKVAVSGNTAIRKTVSVTATQLAAGDAVSVMGQRSADGVITARSVQVGAAAPGDQARGPVGAMTRQGGSPTGEQAQGNMANLSQVSGTVETAAQDKLVVKTETGSVTVAVSDQTSFRKTVDGARSDLAPGLNVMVVGQQASEGVVTASSIQIVPEGDTGGVRRQGR